MSSDPSGGRVVGMLDYVIVGGGISGVSVLEELIRLCSEETSQPIRLTLLQCGSSLTRIASSIQHTERLEEVTQIANIDQQSFMDGMKGNLPEHIQLRILNGRITQLDVKRQLVIYSEDTNLALTTAATSTASTLLHELHYDKVCLCTGARPKLFLPESSQPLPPQILTIRDADSIAHLAEQIASPIPGRAKRICIVGNGGIALELVHALKTSQLNTINATNAVAPSSTDMTTSDSLSSTPTTSLALPPLAVSWLVKNSFLGNTFLDHMASAFLMPELFPSSDPHLPPSGTLPDEMKEEEQIVSVEHGQHARTKLIASETASSSTALSTTIQPTSTLHVGPALGPQWLNQLYLDTNIPKYVFERDRIKATPAADSSTSNDAPAMDVSDSSSPSSSHVDLTLELRCEILEVQQLPLTSPDSYLLLLTLTDGRRLECDLIVSATGVQPNTEWTPSELLKDADGGILVDECMNTSIPHVFAAGDCSKLKFSDALQSTHDLLHPCLFFSARLWSHAKMLGLYSARAMSGLYTEELRDLGGFNFLLFAHTTVIFGQKVILLGQFNLQCYSLADVRQLKSSGQLRTLVRCKPDGREEFIKLHLVNHRLIGAILIGGDETADLEETFENMMLNQNDLEQFGDFLNDVDVDLADYFD